MPHITESPFTAIKARGRMDFLKSKPGISDITSQFIGKSEFDDSWEVSYDELMPGTVGWEEKFGTAPGPTGASS